MEKTLRTTAMRFGPINLPFTFGIPSCYLVQTLLENYEAYFLGWS